MKRLGRVTAIFLLFVVVLISSPNNHPKAASYNMWDLRTFPVIANGYTTSGGFVEAIQSVLWSTGYYATVGTIDGSYGPATSNGIKAFQTRYGLAADGSAGRQTWSVVETYTYNVDHLTRKYRNPNSTTYGTDFIGYTTGASFVHFTSLVSKTNGSIVKDNKIMWEEFY